MMKSMAIVACLAAGVPALAQAQSIGQDEYMNSCAQCHGPDGHGGGPLAGYLTGSLPDLTLLQKDNGGVFPITAVYNIIDGTNTMGPHGTREMPVWGDRFTAEGALVANPDFKNQEAEVYARFRVLALTEYLSTIQQAE